MSFINAYQAATSTVMSVMFLGVKTEKSNGSFSAREEATTVVINQVISSSIEAQKLYSKVITTIRMHKEGSIRTYPVVTTAISGSSSAEEISAGESFLLIDVEGNIKADYICLHMLQFFMIVLLQLKNYQLSNTISIQLFMHTHLTAIGNLLDGYLLTASLFKVFVQSVAVPIFKCGICYILIIATIGSLVSTHQAANYEETESAFLGVLSTVNLTALIKNEGESITTFEERLQTSLMVSSSHGSGC